MSKKAFKEQDWEGDLQIVLYKTMVPMSLMFLD